LPRRRILHRGVMASPRQIADEDCKHAHEPDEQRADDCKNQNLRGFLPFTLTFEILREDQKRSN
jgi:hypothetical protein